MTPLGKMVMVVIGLEAKKDYWSFTDDSLKFAGCTRTSFHSVLIKLQDKGFIRRIRRGLYALDFPLCKAPINFKYHAEIMPLSIPYKEKLLLLAITSYINKSKDYCWVGKSRLQATVNMTEKVYRWTLEKLKTRGLVSAEIINRKNVFSVSLFNLYIENLNTILEAHNTILENVCTIMDNLEASKNGQKQVISTALRAKGISEHIYNILYNIYLKWKHDSHAGKIMVKKAVTAKEAIELAKNKKHGMKKKGGLKLQAIWKSLLGEVCEIENMSSLHLTGKQKGQLNYLAKHWKGSADGIFTMAMEEWGDLMDYVADAAGLDKTPTQPHIGFMQKYMVQLSMYFAGKDLIPKAKSKKVSAKPIESDQEWEDYKKKLKKEMEG